MAQYIFFLVTNSIISPGVSTTNQQVEHLIHQTSPWSLLTCLKKYSIPISEYRAGSPGVVSVWDDIGTDRGR